jgi:hypothetical protein
MNKSPSKIIKNYNAGRNTNNNTAMDFKTDKSLMMNPLSPMGKPSWNPESYTNTSWQN